jgi:hypothetical protein
MDDRALVVRLIRLFERDVKPGISFLEILGIILSVSISQSYQRTCLADTLS